MENKKLIEEIKRVYEVMGLITESARTAIVKTMIRGLDDLMGISSKNADALVREFGTDGANLLRELTSDISDSRPVGEILDDLRKLTNNKAFEEAMTALRLSLDEIVDESGISVSQKLDKIRDGVEQLVNQGQKTDAGKYFEQEFKNVADFGDETLERIVRDEYILKTVQDFDIDDYLGSLDTVKTTSTVEGKSLSSGFLSVIRSYFRNSEKYTQRVIKDTDAYLTLRKEIENLPDGSDLRLSKLETTNKLLNRIEQSLAILRRKDKETVETLIDDLDIRISKLPKKSPERLKLEELSKRAKKSDASIEDIWKYLPDGGYKPDEIGLWQEIKSARKERMDALRKTFNFLPGVKYKGDMKWIDAAWKFSSGNVFKTLGKALKNPKYAGRLLSVDLVSRLISIPFYIGLAETILDGILYLTIQDSITPEWVEEHPNLSYYLSILGADYKDWGKTHGGIDFSVNLLNNVLEKFYISIPAYEIKEWLDEWGHASGAIEFFQKQKTEIDTLISSEEYKNSTEEEKIEKLNKIINETEGFIDKATSKILGETPETIETQINKIIAQVDAEFTNPVDATVNSTGLLPQGLKDTVGPYSDQVKRKNGVWVFVTDKGVEYIMKKGKDLKNNPSEYPFEDESKRSNLEDDMWLALQDKGGNKYHPFNIKPFLNENMHSKGLSILLEQNINPDDPDAQVGGGSNSGSGSSSGSGSNSDAERANQEQKRKEELENRMLAMFEKFMVYDGESERDLIKNNKLTTRDKESIIKDCFDALISKYNGILKIPDEVVDDTVVLNTILFLINDKKSDPLKIMYKSPLELEAKLMESVGLEKILYEQGVGVNYNTIYINYIDGNTEDKIEFIKGGSAERTARANYNKRLGQNSVQDTPTPSPTPRPQQKSEPRPEEAMEIETPKIMKRHMKNEKS